MQIFFIIFDLSATGERHGILHIQKFSLNAFALVLLTKVRLLFLEKSSHPHWFRLTQSSRYIFTVLLPRKSHLWKCQKLMELVSTGRRKPYSERSSRVKPTFALSSLFHSTCGHILTNFTLQGLHKNLWIAKIRACTLVKRRQKKTASFPHGAYAKRGAGIRLKNTIFAELFAFFTISIKW